jgi:hypothetical protein
MPRGRSSKIRITDIRVSALDPDTNSWLKLAQEFDSCVPTMQKICAIHNIATPYIDSTSTQKKHYGNRSNLKTKRHNAAQ